MKKLLTLCLSVGVFVLNGCAFGDLFIDEVEVHNGLVDRMDAVLLAEENFYNEYFFLEDDAPVGMFVDAYSEFKSAVDELDKYFSETKFTSGQQVFIDNYNSSYKPFVDQYLGYAKTFVDVVEAEGYTFDSMESYFEEMDQFTIDFVDEHNALIQVINAQSDYAY